MNKKRILKLFNIKQRDILVIRGENVICNNENPCISLVMRLPCSQTKPKSFYSTLIVCYMMFKNTITVLKPLGPLKYLNSKKLRN